MGIRKKTVETQLYYLNSRYYDSEVCRFISMDFIEYINLDSINGLNLYAYCNNNPINYVDSDEHMPWWVAVLIGGFIYSYFRIANAVRPSNIGL